MLLCLSFAADGKTLVSGSQDSTALVWDAAGLTTERVTVTDEAIGQIIRRYTREAGVRQPPATHHGEASAAAIVSLSSQMASA